MKLGDDWSKNGVLDLFLKKINEKLFHFSIQHGTDIKSYSFTYAVRYMFLVHQVTSNCCYSDGYINAFICSVHNGSLPKVEVEHLRVSFLP